MKNFIFTFLILFNAITLMSQDVKIINVLNNDLIYVPIEDKIYITTPSSGSNGNSLCIVNPYFGNIEQCFFIGSEPNKLAISDDASYLYIGLNGAPEVVKFNIPTKTVEATFYLGEDPFLGQYYAEDIEVLPGQPNSIAVARRNSGFSPKHEGVAIYDNGTIRPNTTQGHTGSNSITFSEHNGSLYGYNNETTEFGFRDIVINPQGATEGNVTSGLISGFGDVIENQGEFIYSSKGEVVNVTNTAPSLAGSFSLNTNTRAAVEPAPDSNVVYFITNAGNSYYLETFNKTTFNNIDVIELPKISGDVRSLINWGNNGKLAFNTNEAVVIMRNCTSLVTDTLVLDPSQTGGCWGESVEITAPMGFDNYYWSTGDTTQSITVDEAGEYFFTTADSLGCLSVPSNSVTVEFDFFPSTPFIFGDSDIEICQGESITLTASNSSSIDSYLWSNGETTSDIEVSIGGTYSVSGVSANGCVGNESSPVTVTVLNDTIPDQPAINVFGELEFCQGESTVLSAPEGYDNYTWSNGQTTQDIEVFNTDFYSVQVGNATGCVSIPSEQVFINVVPTPNQPFIQSNGNVLASSSPMGNQWFFNGTPIVGATQQFYTATESGFYSVQVTINGCPSIISNIFNHTFVSVENPDNKKGIVIYPNPAVNTLNIEYLNNQGHNMPFVELFDATGKMINRFADTNQIEINNIPQGMYLIRIKDHDGSIMNSEMVYKIE